MGFELGMGQNIVITGYLTCAPEDLDLVLKILPRHIALSRAEPGCLAFSITQAPHDHCRFDINERFVDQAAFDAHTARTKKSDWWHKTRHIPRHLGVQTV